MAVRAISAAELVDILKLPAGTTVTATGPALALATSTLANFEGSEESPLLIMSTGIATDVTLPNTGGRQGFDFEPKFFPDGDQSTLTFNMLKPVDAAAVTFDFTFLSEEFPSISARRSTTSSRSRSTASRRRSTRPTGRSR